MVVKVPTDNVSTETKYKFNRKGGKSIIEQRPVFSPDGEFLAVIVQNTVRVYNIQTGDCVRILETERYTDDLIAIEFPSDEEHNLLGCSVGGNITIWTWANGAVLRQKKLLIPNGLNILTFNLLNSNVCLLTLGHPSVKHVALVSYSVKTGKVEIDYKGTIPQYYDMICLSLGWYNGDRFAALTNGSKMLFIQNLDKPGIREQLINHTYIRILSVTAHNGMVAITDALGRVSILRGSLFDNRQKTGREVLHWHFLPLMCSAFSLAGNFLYSGGMEKVLVKWTIGSTAFKMQEKAFMPRLPGMIRYIATNNAYVAICLSNNSIVVANGQMQVTCTILECGGLSPAMRALRGALIYHPKFDGLLMPGRTGHLQLYSTVSDKVLYNIDITQVNELPAERYNLLPLDTEVTCVAISANGMWLATSEYRNDGVNYPEEKLKFWHASRGNTPFELNTCVNLSHGGCNVVALALNHKGHYCISAGADQKFRIWMREKKSNRKVQRRFRCITVCYYSSGVGQYLSHGIFNNVKHHNVNSHGKDRYPYLRQIEKDDVLLKLKNIHKEHALVDSEVLSGGLKRNDDVDMGGIAISQDGSLIAAWFGCKLTLWDTHLCNIRTTLAHPALRPRGIQVEFGSKDAAHYLVCTTENCLAVWSLLSLTIKWMVQIKPSCLAVDRHTNRMAVVTQENDVFVFTPHNSTPIFTRKRLLSPETGVFKQITFGVTPNKDIKLFLMRNNSEIYTIEPEKKEEPRLEAMSWLHQPVTKFGAMIAQQQLSAVKQARPDGDVEAMDVDKATSGAVAEISSAAAHMVPPLNLLVTSFLQQISGSQEPQEVEEPSEDIMDVDHQSSDDEEKPLSEPSPKSMELWTPNYEAVERKNLSKIRKETFIDLDSTSVLFDI